MKSETQHLKRTQRNFFQIQPTSKMKTFADFSQSKLRIDFCLKSLLFKLYFAAIRV